MKTLRRWTWLVGSVGLILVLAACSGQAPPPAAPTATPKPPATVDQARAGPAPPATPTAGTAQPTAVARPAATTGPAAAVSPTTIAALSPQFAALRAAIAVQSAQAYIDAADFHDMEEALGKTKQIQPSYIGTTRNVLAVATSVPWPAELAKEQQRAVADLKALEAALVANQAEAAEKAADAVHESSHDLSQATFAWLAGQKHNFSSMMPMMAGNPMMRGAMVTGVQAAQAYIDAADFHDMEEALGKAKQIQPSYIGTTRNVLAVANAVPWPAELAKEQQRAVADLKALEAALVANQAEAAQKAADAVHESSHDLSQATFAWLAAQKGG